MTRTDRWLAVAGTVGLTAGVLAASLLWLFLTHPLALVQRLGGF